MPIVLHCELPVTQEKINKLWKETTAQCGYPDEVVAIACVEERVMQEMNTKYRGKHKATNVLTFSYGDGQHDVVLCMAVAQQEALGRRLSIEQYTALLLAHAFLHVVGMDHEESSAAALKTQELEQRIMEAVGYKPITL